MAFRGYLKNWPVARALTALTATGASTVILVRTTQQEEARFTLLPEKPQPRPAFRKFGLSLLRLRLRSSEHVSPTSKRLTFELPSENATSGLGLCSAVLTAAWPQGSFFPVVRPYTPVSHSDEHGFIQLTVKRYPMGKMSTHLHSLAPGDTLFFIAAIPSYKWDPNKLQDVTLIAGGAGITPIFQLAQGILNNPEDKTRINLIYGVNNDSEILFKDHFSRWQAQFPGRFNATYVVRDPEPGSSHKKAQLNADLLARLVPRPEGASTMAFVCGPPGLEKALVGGGLFSSFFGGSGLLQQHGFTKAQIYKF